MCRLGTWGRGLGVWASRGVFVRIRVYVGLRERLEFVRDVDFWISGFQVGVGSGFGVLVFGLQGMSSLLVVCVG